MGKNKRRSAVPRAPGCPSSAPPEPASASACSTSAPPSAACSVSACSADGWALPPGAAYMGSEPWECADAGAEVVAAGPVLPCVQLALGSSAIVLIQNVPSELCTAGMMEVVLQQAQIEARILGCWAEDCALLGSVSLALASLEAAERCILHFQGCLWGVGGTDIVAMFVGILHFQGCLWGVG